jgi:hypothetical protein
MHGATGATGWQEVVKVNWLKATSPSFAIARQLAMRFRGSPRQRERWSNGQTEGQIN